MSDLVDLLKIIFDHSGGNAAVAVTSIVAIGEFVVIKYLLQEIKDHKAENIRRTERVDEILDHFMRKTNGE